MNSSTPDSFHLYPAILTESIEILSEQLAMAQAWPEIEVVQIDVIDGFFTDNLTVTPDDVVGLDVGELKLDFHFMTNEPADFVFEAGALRDHLPIRAMIGQIERMGSQAEFLGEVKRQNWLRGLSLDLYTPLEEIDEASWANLEILQLMGIEAGAQGEKFEPKILAKIAAARQEITKRGLKIELLVDGGVKLENAAQILNRGTDSLVIGSEIWTATNKSEVVAKFINLLGRN